MMQSSPVDAADAVHLNIADQAALYDVYMPFLKNGGLFIGRAHLGDTRYALGDEVFLVLDIAFEDERLSVAARVVWIAPRGALQPRGIGVQFLAQDDGYTHRRLETLLADRLDSRRPTSTL